MKEKECQRGVDGASDSGCSSSLSELLFSWLEHARMMHVKSHTPRFMAVSCDILCVVFFFYSTVAHLALDGYGLLSSDSAEWTDGASSVRLNSASIIWICADNGGSSWGGSLTIPSVCLSAEWTQSYWFFPFYWLLTDRHVRHDGVSVVSGNLKYTEVTGDL